jgi:hypothetical protein
VPQVINYVASIFPSLPKSAITDALGKAGGNVHHAVDALLMAKVNAWPDHAESCPSGTGV